MLKRKPGRPAANMTKDIAKLPGIMPNFKAVRYKSMDKIMRGGIEQIPLDVHFVIRLPASSALDKPRGLWDLVGVVTENNRIRAIVTWMSPMPFPFAETVALSDLQRAQLESLVRAGSTPQALVLRCRLILRAADRDHPTNLQIAAEFDCNRHTVAGWRNRYLSNGLAGLQDAPRSGRPRRVSPLGEARSDQFGEQHNRAARLSRHPLVAG
jgi:Winged helix-turn helix